LVLARVTRSVTIKPRRGVRQFFKFGVVGASGALVNFVIYHALLHIQAQLWWAYAVGFLVGGVNNYWWNRHWTFRSSGHAGKELAQFITVSAMALCFSEPVLWFMDRSLPTGLHFRNSVAWVAATVVGMCVNFFVNKYWTFRHTHVTEGRADS
jgi:putative flippase GtrA